MRRRTPFFLHARACAALTAGALGVALLTAASADAVRYASTTGTSAMSCQTPASACDLASAIHGTAANNPVKGEEVIVEPGSYSISTPLTPGAHNMTIHGAAGAPRPLIVGKSASVLEVKEGGSEITLGHLELEEQGGLYAISMSGGMIEGLLIRGTPTGDVLCQCYEGTIRDSVLVALAGSTLGAFGVISNGGTDNEVMRNDTVYSESKEAPAIQLVQQGASGELAIKAFNTIATNAAGGKDLSASKHATITMSHSAYATSAGEGTVTNGGGQVKAPPLFVNVAASNFEELPASPTIDAGLNEAANGALDLEGSPRELGAATDIGALEFVAAPTCADVSGSGAFGAALAVQLQCADLGGAPLSYAIVSPPAHGTVSLEASGGQAVYTPAAGYAGADSFSYDATSRHGTASVAYASISVAPALALAAPAPVAAGAAALTLTGASQSAATWRAGRALARISSARATHLGRATAPLGTTFAFQLNEPASVALAFTTTLAGRSSGRSCIGITRRNRDARHCTRSVSVGSLKFVGHAGRDKISFDGLLPRGKELAPGSYALHLSASVSQQTAVAPVLHFKVAR